MLLKILFQQYCALDVASDREIRLGCHLIVNSMYECGDNPCFRFRMSASVDDRHASHLFQLFSERNSRVSCLQGELPGNRCLREVRVGWL
jgi:hypothetical protein